MESAWGSSCSMVVEVRAGREMNTHLYPWLTIKGILIFQPDEAGGVPGETGGELCEESN